MIGPHWSILDGEQPLFILIAGPNGAGKSTFRRLVLDPLKIACVDPDQKARHLLGRDPQSLDEAYAATISASESIRAAFKSNESVALETVFSDSQGHKLGLLKEAKKLGYRVGIIFIGLANPNLCVARVMDRVDHGGHDVPDELIVSRYPKSLENLKAAKQLTDFIVFVDNSHEKSYQRFAVFTSEHGLQISEEAPQWFNDINF